MGKKEMKLSLFADMIETDMTVYIENPSGRKKKSWNK